MTTTSRPVSRVLATVAATAAALTAFAATPSAHAKGAAERQLSWQLVDTGSTARLRGLAPVSGRVAWASGTQGTVLRTVDAGRTVDSVGPAGTEALQFRSLYASSAEHAVAVSIGDTPDAFRAYVTDDGGRSWTKALQNTDPNAFYDCLTFTDQLTGYILGDPVDGKFQVIRTTDGGHSWQLMPSQGMPAALPGEFAFAASGTCIQSNDRGDLFIGSGGVDPARVFRSTDGGVTWSVQASPVAGGGSAGIFSLSFGHGRGGVAVGGDFSAPTTAEANAAYTTDSGRTWEPAAGLGAYRSGSSWLVTGHGGVLAVGPTGSDVSRDGGRTWAAFDTEPFDSAECTPRACGPSRERGRLARLAGDR
jgi:photosystem II stability/assembly factor-like uncharacterized protein